MLLKVEHLHTCWVLFKLVRKVVFMIISLSMSIVIQIYDNIYEDTYDLEDWALDKRINKVVVSCSPGHIPFSSLE